MNLNQLLVAAIICTMSVFSFSAKAQQGTNTLFAGQKLTEGQRLVSSSGIYYLAMQTDGNMCLKKTKGEEFVWCNMVHLGSGHQLVLQEDGNLVVYNRENKPVWSSMTMAFFDSKYGSPDWKPVRAVIEDDGVFNLYSATNKKVWTNSEKPQPPVVSPGVGYTGRVVKKDLKIKLPGSNNAGNITVEINEVGDAIYQSDMNLGNVEKLAQKASAPQAEDSFKWPGSTVPYVLPANHHLRGTIQKAIDYMNTYTTICLVPRTNQTDYIEFIRDKGNWATLGRVGGRQVVSMEDDNMAVVMHEIMHALGFHHTQCREDRDKYVTINMANVQKGKEHNFIKNTDPQTNLGAYDYNSILHYFSTAFAVNKNVKVITRKDGSTEEMGKFDGMSQTDVDNIAAVYPACKGKAVKPLPGSTKPTTPTPPKPTSQPATGTQPITKTPAETGTATNSNNLANGSYRLSNQFTGPNKVLALNADGQIYLADRNENDNSQIWELTANSNYNGYYRLTNKAKGANFSLDIVNEGDKSSKLMIYASGRQSGQAWLLTPLGNGNFRLTTQWQSDKKSLDVINGGNKDQVHLSASGNYSGQYWQFTPAR